ncbi:DUF3826 domain-containing protein [Tamlana flava]|uniref:DUF3826 domain-containing protein n=1 Tax=Tamlana flava TaxID=3158572 RepID=UPI00351AD58D
MKMKNKVIVLSLLLFFANVSLAQNEELLEKAKSWVKELNLENLEKENNVANAIATHLTEVRNWHNSHPYTTVPAGINPRTGESLSNLDRSIIADSAMPKSVHGALMVVLNDNLAEAQIETILDKYTIGKVAFTMKAYREIVTDMTPEEDAELLKNLKEAREMAIDFKSMKQISAIFEIYKTKNEQYLNNNGRSWRQLYKDYVKRIRNAKKN